MGHGGGKEGSVSRFGASGGFFFRRKEDDGTIWGMLDLQKVKAARTGQGSGSDRYASAGCEGTGGGGRGGASRSVRRACSSQA